MHGQPNIKTWIYVFDIFESINILVDSGFSCRCFVYSVRYIQGILT